MGVDLAADVYRKLWEKKAERLAVYDLGPSAPLAEAAVLACGTSPRHLEALAEELSRLAQARGVRTTQEGRGENGWILIDFAGRTCAHLFSYEARAFYALDRLYEETGAKRVEVGV